MKYFGDELSGLHKEMSGIIRRKGRFAEARDIFFKIHRELHSSTVYETEETAFDRLMKDINGENCGAALWDLWHITRIEDLTAGILIGGSSQLFSNHWAERINSPVSDTGNAMTDSEISDFIGRVFISELLEYRKAVGMRTREIISEMTEADAKRKFPPEYREKLFECGGLVSHPDSAWLADFWLSKDCAGIMFMPLTRHQILHLNQCGKLFSGIKSEVKSIY